MAKYTVELRTLVTKGYDIGLTEYPIFDEAYREVLNNNIINHFYFREIGSETAAQFAFRVRAKMNLIMPYYNKLYGRIDEIDPFITHNMSEDLDETVDKDRNSDYSTTSAVDSSNYGVALDTPQGTLTDGWLEEDTYATAADKNKSESSSSSSNTGTDTTDIHTKYLRISKGMNNTTSMSKLFREYRECLINIDRLIIDELESLFMGLW